MGHIKHHTMSVVDYGYPNSYIELKKARNKTIELGMTASDIVTSPVNEYHSFFVAPDGSKEGWNESLIGDKQREELVNFIRRECPSLVFAEVAINVDGKEVDIEDYKI